MKTLKKVWFVALLCILAFGFMVITACSDDDDDAIPKIPSYDYTHKGLVYGGGDKDIFKGKTFNDRVGDGKYIFYNDGTIETTNSKNIKIVYKYYFEKNDNEPQYIYLRIWKEGALNTMLTYEESIAETIKSSPTATEKQIKEFINMAKGEYSSLIKYKITKGNVGEADYILNEELDKSISDFKKLVFSGEFKSDEIRITPDYYYWFSNVDAGANEYKSDGYVWHIFDSSSDKFYLGKMIENTILTDDRKTFLYSYDNEKAQITILTDEYKTIVCDYDFTRAELFLIR